MKKISFYLFIILSFSNTTYSQVFDLDTVFLSTLSPQGLEISPLSLSIDNVENISSVTFSIDIYPFTITNVKPTHESIKIIYNQVDKELIMNLLIENDAPSGKQLEIFLKPSESNVDYGCGYGKFSILDIIAVDNNNEILSTITTDAGGWYHGTDIVWYTSIQLIDNLRMPVAFSLISILEIIDGPELEDGGVNNGGYTQENGIAKVGFLPVIYCIEIKRNEIIVLDNSFLENFELLLRIGPTDLSAIKYEPIEVKRKMVINPNFDIINNPSLFVPITIVIPITSEISDWQVYE